MTRTGVPGGAPPYPASRGRDEFEVFYRTTAQRTFDLARRVAAGDKHVAHDATQDAYIEILRRWSERRSRSLDDNRRYVAGIAVHKVIDWYRQQGRLTELSDEHDRGCEDIALAHVVEKLSTQQVLQLVRDVIAKQPPARRAVAALVFIENRECDDVARILNVAPSTVRTQVQRLRQALRPLVKRAMEIEQEGDWS